MKRILRITIVSAVLAGLAGCRPGKSPAWYSDDWRGFPYQEAKDKLDDYSVVMLVCVTADHLEEVETEVAESRKPGGYLHHYTATVVKVYKGRCKVRDRVAFVEDYCPCGGEREITTDTLVGKLMFLLVEDKVPTGAEFGIDPFDTERYDSQTDRLFTHIFRGY